jgi:hypothetical protein
MHQVLRQMLRTAEIDMAKSVTHNDFDAFLDNVAYLEADVRRNKRKMGGFASREFLEQVSKFGFFCSFPATHRF